ncbi:hypothetical protein [Pseudobacteriovorax antillogorgiicola]|uniref:Uncharacterized protein n=1 Tax=Pseudobacteriovorax antillogorgiicola TaxID=1513793 RepID=A0A1Y6CVE4_9BACT|nr:hypothetical protein [Pseudobacteriovorax antillogorgiicola]TCS43628.1 hypothetical protein EDD56_13521 [Pseudobacteriovorax antillogorgiicola]SMF80008.1 hypothetical protein SAMN06296036_13432 [Pseudobacteriovorax antillogorgiicola]
MNQEGNSLLSLLVSVSILGIISLAVTKLGNTANFVERQSRSTYSWTALISSAQKGFSNVKFCTKNLGGRILPALNESPILIQKVIDLNDRDFIFPDQELTSGKGSMKVLSLSLSHHVELSNNRALGDFNIKLAKQAPNGKILSKSHKIPIQFEIDPTSREIITCSRDINFAGTDANEQICHLSSNGKKVYDPATGKCVSLTETVCYQGNRRGASCVNPNETISSCRVEGIEDKFSGVKRAIEGGFTTQPSASVVQLDYNSNSCTCLYALSEVDSSSARCVACCAGPSPFALKQFAGG